MLAGLSIVLVLIGLFGTLYRNVPNERGTRELPAQLAHVLSPTPENLMPDLPQTAGLYELETGPHTYTLYLPDGFDSAETYPLIVSLHFAGYNGPHYGRSLLEAAVIDGFRELNAIIVAPDAQSWVSQLGATSAMDVTQLALDAYRIDRERVLLTGYSMGGGGTWFLGAQTQDLFTALMPMAAFPRPDSAEKAWTIPIIALNSTADELFDYATAEQRINEIAATGADVTLVTVNNVSHYRADQFAPPIQAAVPLLLEKWK